MTTASAPPDTASAEGSGRLLAGWRSRHGADLDAHTRMYGQILIPAGDPNWSTAFANEIEASGLTGRGGGGFSSWRKLDAVRSASRAPTLIVNAMEGEPASSKDRVLLACSPHLVLDGAQITAAAIGAARIMVCVAQNDPDSAESVFRAIDERQRRIPDRIPFEVARPPGRFITGEESALASWLDGRTAAPTFRTDKAIPLRVKRRPVLIHNAETLAHAALISRRGWRWFRQCGTSESPGTTLVTVSGAVDNPGVYEVALGTELDKIVVGAGLKDWPGAVIVGGYGGSVVGPDQLAVGFCNEELCAVGASTGAGVVAVIPRSVCGVAETARAARYLARQSSGQCGPCMFGLPAIASSLESLWRGEGGAKSLQLIESRLGQVTGRGACRHPDGAARFVSTAMRVFSADFASHAVGRPCRFANRQSVLHFGREGHR
ncbi:MAG: NADH-ubiquinone oxidoreductase-F iron-sulfur binding region domain-containing protein [Acidimicrobiales bacterium]